MLRGLNRFDIAIVVFCFVTGSMAIFYFLSDFGAGGERGSEEQEVAQISKLINDGRVKAHKDFTYFRVNNSDKLYNNDTVFSGSDSYMDITLHSGGTIKLSPKSLLILSRKESISTLDLIRGLLNGHVAKGEVIVLQTASGLKKIRGVSESKIVVQNMGSSLEVRVLGGSVELKTAQGSQRLAKNQKVNFLPKRKTTRIKAKEILSLAPLNSGPIVPDNIVLSAPPTFVVAEPFSKNRSVGVVDKKYLPSPLVVQKEEEDRAPASPDHKVAELKLPHKNKNARFYLWGDYWSKIGIGMNYVRYDQTGNDFAALNFQSLKGPAFYFDVGAYLSKHIGVEASYKNTLGQFNNQTKGQGAFQYSWKTYTADVLYRKNLGSDLGFEHTQFIWRGGFQRHLAPFVKATDLADSLVDISENQLFMGHLGFSYYFTNNKKLRYELTMRYQHPLSANLTGASGYSLTPNFAFDGSIGMTYRLYQSFNMGVHWYGQWHSFNYQFENGANSVSGRQSLFFSNFDLRLGVEY